MTQILVGQFDDFDKAGIAADDLRSLGLASDDAQVFFLNAAGQHDRFPIGGDEDADRGAKDGDTGAMAGAALGGAAGLAIAAAAIPVVGPAAAALAIGVGAYTGSLAGAVNTMGEDSQQVAMIAPRPAGVRLAAHTSTSVVREFVLSTLRRHGARSIEEATGTWREGRWVDFDPVSVPRWVVAPPAG